MGWSLPDRRVRGRRFALRRDRAGCRLPPLRSFSAREALATAAKYRLRGEGRVAAAARGRHRPNSGACACLGIERGASGGRPVACLRAALTVRYAVGSVRGVAAGRAFEPVLFLDTTRVVWSCLSIGSRRCARDPGRTLHDYVDFEPTSIARLRTRAQVGEWFAA